MRGMVEPGDVHVHRATCSHGCTGSHCCETGHRHLDPASVPWRRIASLPATRSDAARASLLLRSGEIVPDISLARAALSDEFELLGIKDRGGRIVAEQEVALVCVDLQRLVRESDEARAFSDRTGAVFQHLGVVDYRGNFN